MCKNLDTLINQAANYTEAYAKQYGITDVELLHAIFVTHLAYLLNEK